MGRIPGLGAQPRGGHRRFEPRLPGAQYPGKRMLGIVWEDRVVRPQQLDQGRLRNVRMRERTAMELPIRLDEVDTAPVSEAGNEEAR